ncbi:MAG: hypothetical protein JRN67_04835, partial [Nitrososphaerota archaeon]|nr:hypothetical protein [Nitrososphaerota archaeon]
MDDRYRIAIAFSNVQGLYSVPPLIAGVVASENDYVELATRNLPRKSTLIRRKNSLAGFQETFNDVSEYLTCHLVLPAKGRFDLPLFENTCIKAINILRSSHLFVIAGHIKSIVIKAPSKYDITSKSWKTMPLSEGFITKIRDITPNYEILEKATKSARLLEVAKILARLEFERQRSYNGEYVTRKVERNPLAFNQLIRLSWNSPSVDEYANELVGPPALIYRDPRKSRVQLKAFPIGSKIDVIPLAKFCKGRQIDHDTIPCVSSTTKNPFGQHLIGSSTEQCTQCSEHFDNSICLYRKPLCNGFQVKCGNPEFAGHICCGLFGLYVTRFGTELKVGTAVLSNVVGRLLDQGAGFAAVAYPLEGIMTAYELEG